MAIQKSIREQIVIVVILMGVALVLSGCGGAGGSQYSLTAPNGSTATGSDRITTVPGGCDAASLLPNYILGMDPASGKANTTTHWNSLPVTIAFIASSELTSARRQAILNGFNWWTQSTGGFINYQVVTDPAAAQITVTVHDDGITNYGALTNVKFQNDNQLISGTITFNTHYLTDIAFFTPAAAHEFGHALGIGGHSDDNDDVMSYSSKVYTLTGLSQRDVNTIRAIYCGAGVGRSQGGALRELTFRSKIP